MSSIEPMDKIEMTPCMIICICPGKVGGVPQASCGKIVAVVTLTAPMAIYSQAPTVPERVVGVTRRT